MNIIFAGTAEFGLPCLQALIDSPHKIIGVYTQPDRPAGRGQKLHISPIKELAIKNALPIFQPETFKEQKNIDELKSLQPDLIVVVAYGLILTQAALNIPKFGCINIHGSLLPRWRGACKCLMNSV